MKQSSYNCVAHNFFHNYKIIVCNVIFIYPRILNKLALLMEKVYWVKKMLNNIVNIKDKKFWDIILPKECPYLKKRFLEFDIFEFDFVNLKEDSNLLNIIL